MVKWYINMSHCTNISPQFAHRGRMNAPCDPTVDSQQGVTSGVPRTRWKPPESGQPRRFCGTARQAVRTPRPPPSTAHLGNEDLARDLQATAPRPRVLDAFLLNIALYMESFNLMFSHIVQNSKCKRAPSWHYHYIYVYICYCTICNMYPTILIGWSKPLNVEFINEMRNICNTPPTHSRGECRRRERECKLLLW